MVEALVGGALMVGVGVGVMNLGQVQKKSERGIKTVSGIDQFVGMLRGNLGEAAICRENFLSKKVGKNETLSELKGADGSPFLTVGESYMNGTFRITGVTIGAYNPNSKRSEVILDIEQTQKSTRVTNSKRILSIFTEVTGDTITNCLDPVELSGLAAVKKLCMDIDPTGDTDCENNLSNLTSEVKELFCSSGALPFVNWNSATQSCVPIDAGKLCASGFAQGFNSAGNLLCYTP